MRAPLVRLFPGPHLLKEAKALEQSANIRCEAHTSFTPPTDRRGAHPCQAG